MSHFFAACSIGLEYLLVDELKALGARDVHEARAGVHFSGDLELAYRVILWSRLCSRVTQRLAEGPIAGDDDLYALARTIDWSEHLPWRGRMDINASTRHPQLKDSRYAAQRVRDAVADRLRESGRGRPVMDRKEPDLRLVVFCSRNDANISVDLAGLNLSQRGYRTEAGAAPLREDLAAAVLIRANWPLIAEQGGGLADPLCGSGTLPIEAALMAGGVAPGLRRGPLASNWTGHDAELWRRLLVEARERSGAGLTRLSPCLYGSDHDGEAIAMARRNAERAGVSEFIRFEKVDLRRWSPPRFLPDSGLVVCNPPYGERLGEDDRLFDLYRILGERLKSSWVGWQASVLTGNPEASHAIGLRPEKRYKLRNGPIHCVLVNFGAIRSVDPESDRPRDPGGEMLANRLRKNLKRLRKYLNRNGITCFRAYDADLPEFNLAIDVYGDRLHLQEYRAPADVPAATAARRRAEAARVVAEVFEVPPEALTLKLRERQRGSSQYERSDRRGEFFTVSEGGLDFLVNLEDYLDTGLFLDHRETRNMIRERSADKRVLNLFCYTGSVSVYAAAGGATAVTSVDLSKTYLDWARRNLALNGLERSEHRFVQADCMEWLARDGGEYDLIFVDPPTFSNSKRMDEDFEVQRDHVRLLRACLDRLSPSGELIFSNNFNKFELDTEALADFEVEEITHHTVPPDFVRTRPHRCWSIRKRSPSVQS